MSIITFTISGSDESEYESASQSLNTSISPRKNNEFVNDGFTPSEIDIASITDVLASFKIQSTAKKENIARNEDADEEEQEKSFQKTPTPPNLNIKPSEIEDLVAQLKISANDSEDNEVQFNIRDASFQSVTEENEKASKNDVLVSITPNVPAAVITKIKQTCGDANTTPNDVERIRTQEPQKPQKG